MDVVLVDDHALFREGFKLLLAQLWGKSLRAQEVSSAEEGLALPADTAADIIFLDLGLPGMNGLAGLRAFRTRFPTASVVVVSAVSGNEMIRQALAGGAQGYIPKSSTGEEMLAALERIQEGEIYSPEPVIPVVEGVTITPRQIEVLGELCNGLSNRDIAEQLGMSENTVRVHIRSIFNAFGVESRTGAALEAKRLGLF